MEKIPIMINGLPGNVAQTMAVAGLTDDRFIVIPYSLTGADILEQTVTVGKKEILLLKPDTRDDKIKEILSDYPEVIAVD